MRMVSVLMILVLRIMMTNITQANVYAFQSRVTMTVLCNKSRWRNLDSRGQNEYTRCFAGASVCNE